MIENSQIEHYTNLFETHGISPKSVGWTDDATQQLRFQSIAKLFGADSNFSVHEVGCGLGHFGEYLKQFDCSYNGSDLVPEFVTRCQNQFPGMFVVHNIANPAPESVQGFDYYCLSGSFHTKRKNPTDEWEQFIKKSILNMYGLCRKGISINFLTTHADYQDPLLYYRDPSEALRWALGNLSRFCSIEHTLPLFEYTLYIYKPEWIKKQYPHMAERYL